MTGDDMPLSSDSWLLALLSAKDTQLPAIDILLEQGHATVADPNAQHEGKGYFGWLAWASRFEAFESLNRERHAGTFWSDTGVEKDHIAPRPVEAVFMHLLKAGVNPWASWSVPPSPANPAGQADAFDLACALGSAPLAQMCLQHPARPALQTLWGRSAWRLVRHEAIGSLWTSRLSPKDTLLPVASAQDAWGLAKVLLSHGWPWSPPKGTHPLMWATSKKMIEVLAPNSDSETLALPEGLTEAWSVLAKKHQRAERSLAARMDWLKQQPQQQGEAIKALAKRAFEQWKSKDHAGLATTLESFGVPAQSTYTESERLAREKDKGLAWLSMPPLPFSSGGFLTLGPLPLWWAMATSVLTIDASKANKSKPRQTAMWLSWMAGQPGSTWEGKGEQFSARGAGLMIAQRVASGAPSPAIDEALVRLGWSTASSKVDSVVVAASACQTWLRHGTAAQKTEAAQTFRGLCERLAAENALPSWNDDRWDAIRQACTETGCSPLMTDALIKVLKKAPLAWCLDWVNGLMKSRASEASSVALGKILEKAKGQAVWDTEASEKALALAKTPPPIPDQWKEEWSAFAARAKGCALEAAFPEAAVPSRPRVKL